MQSPLDLPALFDQLPNAFMVLDRDLRYVTANAAYLRITGSTLDTLVGRYIMDAFPDDPTGPSANAAILRASFDRVLSTGKPDEVAAIKYRVPRTPGGPPEDRIWSARHTPLLDAHGRVEHIIQETTEVTHLQSFISTDSPTHLEATILGRAFRAQSTVSSLDAQLRDLRQLFAQTPGFIAYTHGPGHVFAVVNAAYLQLVGHRDVVGLSVAEALPEVVEQGFIGLLDRVFSTGEPFIGRDLPVMLQRTSGGPLESRFVDFIYQPIRNTDGQVTGIFVQGQDVTEEHRAKLERDASDAAAADARRGRASAEARQLFLIESLPVQVWTSTAEGKLDFVSQRVVAYFEQPAEKILGDGWLAVLHPDDVATVGERWTHSLATGDSYEVEFRLRRGDGQYRWHLGRANAERDAANKVVAWFGTNTDIHDAKRALAELEARSQYEQRLIGIVSHDLRNPLNAIGLAGAALEASAKDPLVQKMTAIISRASNRATRLIRDLLDFAKKRTGATIPINPRPTNLREVIEQVVDELRVTVPNRAIRVDHAGAEDGAWDADRIAQVISNLVGNALQHGSATTPIVVASSIDKDSATLEITNHGPPISPADIAHLFEPFARATNASPSAGSLGLGLYIAREVVVAHGGRIDVDSQSDTGTRFTVRLPRFAST
jgi:PAS domain S-box-containing protein